jgi:hypothetical protein
MFLVGSIVYEFVDNRTDVILVRVAGLFGENSRDFGFVYIHMYESMERKILAKSEIFGLSSQKKRLPANRDLTVTEFPSDQICHPPIKIVLGVFTHFSGII